MDWSEPIRGGLPAERADEPPTLRQDIDDELSDHLACALERERRRTDNEALARKAVLERFGDPAKLARKLWWAAMKEIVMRERIIFVVVIVLALVCLATAAFSMLMLRQGQQVNQAILAKLESVVVQPDTPALPGDWAKVKFQVTGERDGKPVEGLNITVKGEPFHTGKKENFAGNTDSQGNVELGPFRPGSYEYVINSGQFSKSATFVLYPGRETGIFLVVPEYEEAKVSMSIKWPADLRENGLLCTFHAVLHDRVEGEYWSAGYRVLAITPDRRIVTGKKGSLWRIISSEQGTIAESDFALAERFTLPVVTSYKLSKIIFIATEDYPDRPGFMSWTTYPHGTGLNYTTRISTFPELTAPALELPQIHTARENHWNIELPEETWKLIREWVAELESKKQKQTVPEQ